MRIKFAQFDFEVTNRCNADCHFCPRDLTPHEGIMEPDVFRAALDRAAEFAEIAVKKLDAKVNVALCGLGEPLLNKHLASYVRQVRDAGFDCSVSSNGGLLTEKKAKALLDAGLTRIDLNIGEQGESYEEIYKLNWDKTHRNVVRFIEMAEGRCQVMMILVNHRRDRDHIRAMVQFWRERGVKHFQPYEIINRGGALDPDSQMFGGDELVPALADIQKRTADAPICVAPFVSHFVGYDGQHYLCCQDWTKKTAMGTVFDRSFMDVMGKKLEFVTDRGVVCSACNVDPVNKVTEARLALAEDRVDAENYEKTVDQVAGSIEAATDVLERLGMTPPVSIELGIPSPDRRRLPIVSSEG